MGVLQVRDGEKGASINGVLFPAPSDMSEFDKRENGYQRVEVPPDLVELLSWHRCASHLLSPAVLYSSFLRAL